MSGGSSGAGQAGDTSDAGAGGVADPCAACPGGLCLPSGACVECVASDDHCPDGQYCTSQNECAPGCKADSACASGVCTATHDCQSCLADQECAAPHVCGNNACAPSCTTAQEGTAQGCGTGLTCCSLHCVDATTDSAHCGACGTACTAGQFCGLTGCHETTLSGVCSIAKVAVVLDGQTGNETPAKAIAHALQLSCAPAPTVRQVPQDVADVVNVDTGRPVAGGDELLVAAGGSYFSHLISYASTQPILPIYSALNGTMIEYRELGTAAVVASAPAQEDTAHDYFVIQIARDPSSGSVLLNAQGFFTEGTTAAAFYFEQGLLPTLATLSKSWYLYEWTDADGDLAPDLAEISAVASGN